MQIEIVGQSGRSDTAPKAAPSRLINVYSETLDGERVLRDVLGMKEWIDIGQSGVRAMLAVGGLLFIAADGKLLAVDEAGGVELLGVIRDGTDTTISANNGKVTVVCDGAYYVWDGSTLSKPAPGAFDQFGDVTFFGQLTVLTERGGRRVQWSSVADPTALGGLDFATTESRDDANLRVIPVGGALWFFKEGSIERWTQSGAGLRFIPGSTLDVGLKGRNLVASMPNDAAFVGSDNRFYLSNSGPISTAAVETSIATGQPVTVLHYADEGTDFACIVFGDRPAWCYNLTTGEWHERASGDDLGPWTGRHAVTVWGREIAADFIGRLYHMEGSNDGSPLHRQITTRTVGGQRFRVKSFEFLMNTGRHDSGDVMLRTSGDHGMTWGPWQHVSLGARGDYARRVVFRALGQFEALTMQITYSSNSDVTLNPVANLELV